MRLCGLESDNDMRVLTPNGLDDGVDEPDWRERSHARNDILAAGKATFSPVDHQH
jgi:hypothetical protein